MIKSLRNGSHFSLSWCFPLDRVNITLLALAAVFFGNCSIKKHLDQSRGERLLVKTAIELKDREHLRLSERSALTSALENQIKQKPSRREFFGLIPARQWLYYKYRNPKSRMGRWIATRLAEPPAIYSDSLARRTTRSLENYVKQRGYFRGTATYDTDSIGRYRASTNYIVALGPLYTIDSVNFTSRDTNMLDILHLIKGQTYLKRGVALDGQIFEMERNRINREVKNRGYAFFAPSFIDFLGDSTGTTANIVVNILLPTDSSRHKQYVLNNIAVFSSLVPDYSSIFRDTTIEGVYFASSERKFPIRPSRLIKNIYIRPGNLYRQEDFDNTTRRLNALGVFRFVAVRPSLDSSESEAINVAVSYSMVKKLPVSGDFDVNTSSSSLTGQLLGFSASGSLRNRNLFRGAENLNTTVSYNVEFDISNVSNRPIFSQDIKLSNELTIPRYFDYLGLYGNLERWTGRKRRAEAARSGIGLNNKSLYYKMQRDGQARFGLTFNYLDLTNYYIYNLVNATFGYNLRDGERQYTFDHIGIDVLRPDTRPLFDSLVVNNQFLQLSFGNQLFTGFFLRSFTYQFNGTPNPFGAQWFWRLRTEVSGAEILALNELWSLAFGKERWGIGDLEFSKYARLEIDGSYSREYLRGVTAAFRLGSGVVVPFADTRQTPYIKQFFVGGPSSLRAWRIRELGPGGFCERDPETGECILELPPRTAFYQAGDFRLEFNAELRFPLFWWFKGAVFLDGGNIWTLKPDSERPGAELRWDSYKNIALGTGMGLRGDFDFLVLRFDVGLKLRRPFPDSLGRYWIQNRFSKLQFRNLVPNLAVGYPF